MSELIIRTAKRHITGDFDPSAEDAFLRSCTPGWIAENIAGAFRYHIAVKDLEILGLIGIRDDSHVFHLFVETQRQSVGLGKQLWLVGLEACCSAGHTGSMTVNSSLNAVRFYERLGFRVNGPTDHREGVVSVPMVRNAV